MLHPLEQVRDHQNPLADTPALAPCQAPQLRRPRFAAKKYAAIPHPQNATSQDSSTIYGASESWYYSIPHIARSPISHNIENLSYLYCVCDPQPSLGQALDLLPASPGV